MTPLFAPLEERRECPDWLPADLADFYAEHRPVAAAPHELRDVHLHNIDRLALDTGASQPHLADVPAKYRPWAAAEMIEVGRGLFGDALLYIVAAPTGDRGRIYALGPDVSGPRFDDRQPSWLVCLAGSFPEWIERLGRDQWSEYGLVPGELKDDVPEPRATELRAYFAKLNNDESWLRPDR